MSRTRCPLPSCLALWRVRAQRMVWRGVAGHGVPARLPPVSSMLRCPGLQRACNRCRCLPAAPTSPAGMMVYVSVKELLPQAFRFDPKDQVVSTSERGEGQQQQLQQWGAQRGGGGGCIRGRACVRTCMQAPCALGSLTPACCLLLPPLLRCRRAGGHGGHGGLAAALHAVAPAAQKQHAQRTRQQANPAGSTAAACERTACPTTHTYLERTAVCIHSS